MNGQRRKKYAGNKHKSPRRAKTKIQGSIKDTSSDLRNSTKQIKKQKDFEIKAEPVISEPDSDSLDYEWLREPYFEDESEKTFEACTVPLTQRDKEKDQEQMRKFGLKECSVFGDDLQMHFQCASSIAFAKSPAFSGIVIKCLQGCDFHGIFTSFKTMHKLTNEHFEKKHPGMKWSGFCSKCERFFDKTTIKDELLHIEYWHTTKKS